MLAALQQEWVAANASVGTVPQARAAAAYSIAGDRGSCIVAGLLECHVFSFAVAMLKEAPVQCDHCVKCHAGAATSWGQRTRHERHCGREDVPGHRPRRPPAGAGRADIPLQVSNASALQERCCRAVTPVQHLRLRPYSASKLTVACHSNRSLAKASHHTGGAAYV